MSLSQERPTNPSKFFLKVKSGGVSYYNKEDQENVSVPVPFEFIVLDQLGTIKGWSDADESGYWSNEVRSTAKEVLNVRTNKGLKGSGIWREIKGDVGIAGAKYHSSIYIAHKGKSGLEISNLSLTGAALNAWIEFANKVRFGKNKVVLTGFSDAKKGSVSYKVPVFESKPMSDVEHDEAVELDKQLQVYLNEYFSYKPEESNTVTDTHVQVAKAEPEDEIEEEPINLDDIPF